MEVNDDVWIYNRIPNIKSGLSAINIWSSSSYYPVSENLCNFHVWGCPTYVLEQKLQKPGFKIPKWDFIIQIGVNIGFRKMY